MGDTQSRNGRAGSLRAASAGSISGEHPTAPPFQFLVGPSTATESNTARLPLVPLACWQVGDIRFAFDSSFVDAGLSGDPSDIREDLQLLTTLVRDHPGAPLSVFGHADPVGNDAYNKLLSGRRAMAIYALVIVNTDASTSVKLWRQIAATENWGKSQRQTMHTVTGLPPGTPDAALFEAYMRNLCPPDLQLGKKDFLGQGADALGKADFQGCGEFNPLLLFSAEQQAEFDRAQQKQDKAGIQRRNNANAPNRRVMVLLFRKGSKVDPSRWPCPRATEGVAGCIKRFWSDGEARRARRERGKERKFEETQDTFSCRFYQRVSNSSPCDRILSTFKIRLFDSFGEVLPGAPFVVISGKDQSPVRTADTNGEITLRDIGAEVITIKWSRPPEKRKTEKAPEEEIVIGRDGVERVEKIPPLPNDQFEFEREVVLSLNQGSVQVGLTENDAANAAGARGRLNNMGYIVGDQLSDLIRAFQRDIEVLETGILTKEVMDKIKEFHDQKVESPGFSPGIVKDDPLTA